MKINIGSVIELLKNNVQIVVTVVVVAALSSYIGMWTKNTEIEEWKERYDVFRDSAAVVRQENEQLLVRVGALTEQVRQINDSIASLNEQLEYKTGELVALRRDLDSLRINITPEMLEVTPPAVLEYVATLEETVETQDTIIQQMSAREALRVRQVDSLFYANDLLTAQLDSVNVLLDGIPEGPSDPDKIFGFIPKPSRTQSYFLGVITTAVVIWGVS